MASNGLRASSGSAPTRNGKYAVAFVAIAMVTILILLYNCGRTAIGLRFALTDVIDHVAECANNDTYITGLSDDLCALNTTKVFRILLWTSFFGDRHFGFGLGHQPFLKRNCSFTNCVISTAPSLLMHSDAIVFHLRDIDLSYLPAYRISMQRWALFNLESPYHVPQMHDFNGLFNWTMSYKRNSDIFTPYATVQSDPKARVKLDVRAIGAKSKKVAWLVSNCKTPGGREAYVEELSKYISVDIYGKCGKLKCAKDDFSACYGMIEKEYKFYLSFENSICDDYVTEKFFNVIKYNVVPVVYGRANYSLSAPPGSFIDVRDYPSPRELAAHLNYLSDNLTAYMSYLSWKEQGFSVGLDLIGNMFCDLCARLNLAVNGATSVYDRIDRWFSTDQCVPKFESASKS